MRTDIIATSWSGVKIFCFTFAVVFVLLIIGEYLHFGYMLSATSPDDTIVLTMIHLGIPSFLGILFAGCLAGEPHS